MTDAVAEFDEFEEATARRTSCPSNRDAASAVVGDRPAAPLAVPAGEEMAATSLIGRSVVVGNPSSVRT